MSISAKDTYDPSVSSSATDLSNDEEMSLLIPILPGEDSPSEEVSSNVGCWKPIAQKTKEIAEKVWKSITWNEESDEKPQPKISSIPSSGLSIALIQELTTTNHLTKLRSTSQPIVALQGQPEVKESHNTATKFVSEFFMDSYKKAPQKLFFQRDLPYEQLPIIIPHHYLLPDIDSFQLRDKDSYELQNADRVQHVSLINKIAALLIPHPNVLNADAINPLINILHKGEINAATAHLIEVLKSILTSDTLRSKLISIPAPAKDSPGDMLVRLSLNLPRDHTVTNLETQQAALAALLSYCRQGKSGTCFATFLTIALKASNLELCLNDFVSLIINHSLMRNSNGKILTFPLNMTMSKEQLNLTLSLDKNGGISSSGSFIWESAGISAACRALNIQNPSAAITKILANAPKSPQDELITITLDDFLKELAKMAQLKDYQVDLMDLYLLATTAYESQTYNPLLRAWENAIAAMAEGAENGFIKPQIIDSVLFSLERKLIHSIPAKPDLEKKIEHIIENILHNRIHLQFSPDIVHGRSDDDGNSQQGAFVVYDTNNSTHSSDWQLVDDAGKFQNFIQLVLKEAKDSLKSDKIEDENLYDPCLNALSAYVSTEEFVLQSVKKCGYYQPKNSPANFDNIDTAPWMFKTGTNPKKVLQIYFEMEEPPIPKSQSFRNAKNLIAKIAENIGIHKEWLAKSTSNLIFLPAALQGLHVFSLIPKQISLQPLLKDQVDVSKWLEENLEKPGKAISQNILPDLIRANILDDCKKTIKSLEDLNMFKEAIKQIKADSTITEFREALLVELRLHAGKDEPLAKLALELDSIIIKNLPKEWVKELTDKALHFADTNWFDGNRDIHFCVMVNPGIGQLELWKINEDNSNPVPIDQNYWLKAHQWEFFIIKDI